MVVNKENTYFKKRRNYYEEIKSEQYRYKKMTFGQRLERYIEKNGKAFAAIDAAWTGRLYGRY